MPVADLPLDPLPSRGPDNAHRSLGSVASPGESSPPAILEAVESAEDELKGKGT